MPVEILGLERCSQCRVRSLWPWITRKRREALRRPLSPRAKRNCLEETKSRDVPGRSVFIRSRQANVKELDIIVKADVQGSVEAVKQSLLKLSNEEVVVKVIHGGVGAINESDVIPGCLHPMPSSLAFNVRPDASGKGNRRAGERGCPSVQGHLSGHRGCGGSNEGYAGSDLRGAGDRPRRWCVRLSRLPVSEPSQVPMCWTASSREAASVPYQPAEGEQIFEGDPQHPLKRFKDDVKEVKAGYECGLVFGRIQ